MPGESIDVNEAAREWLLSLQSCGVEFLPYVAMAARAAVPRTSVSLPAQATKTTLPARYVSPPPAKKAELSRTPLDLLRVEVSNCMACGELASVRVQTVFGEGASSPTVLFLGDTPTAADENSGLPFSGPLGELFNKMVAACGLTKEEIYITNAIKCRTPGSREPNAAECGNCSGFLRRELAAIRPKMVCCFGPTATRVVLGENLPFEKARGEIHHLPEFTVVSTLHPKTLKGQGDPNRRVIWNDLRAMMNELGRPVG